MTPRPISLLQTGLSRQEARMDEEMLIFNRCEGMLDCASSEAHQLQ